MTDPEIRRLEAQARAWVRLNTWLTRLVWVLSAAVGVAAVALVVVGLPWVALGTVSVAVAALCFTYPRRVLYLIYPLWR